ncbi:hypothetical protein PTSG_08637 [Salpingoeca rosetta]|uniref:Uncharacterized protein n=1 Tax=Salpingoeca rosetta (strain ATCC 50818 / BSB-021) TaxID=946362 RepID=F2UK90_SALR5|nr:uncharacterized protein PTSG_08637 [Salpingoeca rosetta]EGD77539.1 hypothetical protein PTSG_08637 [Salpingoeca rosetta]|eukprot:XP_004990427.1 hypothetical protein PTSG_08637 [Salpingoeca rosetta]
MHHLATDAVAAHTKHNLASCVTDEGVVSDTMDLSSHANTPPIPEARHQPTQAEQHAARVSARLAQCLRIREDAVPLSVCSGVITVSRIWLRSSSHTHSLPSSPRSSVAGDNYTPRSATSTMRKVKSHNASDSHHHRHRHSRRKPKELCDVLRGSRGPLPLLDATYTPDCCNDDADLADRASDIQFVLGASRARAEAILTTGARLREDPQLSWRFSPHDAEHDEMCSWREQLGRPEKLMICVVSEDGFDLDHPALHEPNIAVTVLTTNMKLAQNVIRYRRNHRQFAVSCSRELSAAEALDWARHRYTHVTVEAGPQMTNFLFRGPAPTPVLFDSVWMAAFRCKSLPHHVALHHGINAEEISDFFEQQHTPKAGAVQRSRQKRKDHQAGQQHAHSPQQHLRAGGALRAPSTSTSTYNASHSSESSGLGAHPPRYPVSVATRQSSTSTATSPRPRFPSDTDSARSFDQRSATKAPPLSSCSCWQMGAFLRTLDAPGRIEHARRIFPKAQHQ